MKIGMHLSLWTDRPEAGTHGPLFEKLKAWGADGVELPVLASEEADLQALAKRAEALELGRTAALVLTADRGDPASADPALRRAATELICRAVDRTKLIGADLLSGPLFQGLGRFTGAGPTPDEWRWAVDSLHQAAGYAAQQDVTLALEPLNRFEMYLVNTVADGVRFVRDVGLPNVGLLVDTHHANIEENDAAVAWEEAFDCIRHVHISENHRSTPGTGHAVRPEIIHMLHRRGYDGWLTIEAFGQSVPGRIGRLHLWRAFPDSDDDVARKGIAFVRELLDNLPPVAEIRT